MCALAYVCECDARASGVTENTEGDVESVKKTRDKRYVESRWVEFSCSGFGRSFSSEGTMRANKSTTILSDNFHHLESF